jgi:DHA3 family macrolide efflux protein-like MFS transporter
MSQHKYIVLFRDNNFLFFWIGIFGFGLGGIIFSISLNWYVYIKTSSELQLGLVGTLTMLPMLIFCSFSGVITDFFNRQILIIISLLMRGLVVFLLPIFSYLQILDLWVIYLFAFLQGLSLPIFVNALNAIMPEIIKQENLFAANALTDSAVWSSQIIGSPFTGFLINSIGILPLFLISTYIFIGSSLIFLFIKYTSKKRFNSELKIKILGDIKNGIKIINRDKVLFTLIITWMGIRILFANGPTSIGWPVFSEKVYNSGAEGYGLLISSISLSSLIGSLALGHWGSKIRKRTLILIGYLWGAIGILLFSFITNFFIGLIIVFIWNMYIPLINIPFWTTLQERIPEKDLGKVLGASLNMSYALNPISIIMTGYMMEYISVPLPFILLGISLFVCFTLVYKNKEIRILV